MAIEAAETDLRAAAAPRWSPRATALFSVGVSLAFWFVAGLVFSALV